MDILRLALAVIFAYLAFKDGIVDGCIIYAILFALLSIEYIYELLDKVNKKLRRSKVK